MNLEITWATVEFGVWSSTVHHENMLKILHATQKEEHYQW